MLKPSLFLAGVAGLLAVMSPANAQVSDPNSGIQFARGQDVVPAFEGWQKNTDGTYTFYYGYFNRNYEEEVNVPVGPNNMFEPGNIDRGQPARFYTRRHFFVYKVIVPKDWPADQKLVWTLTTHGHTNKAKGWLEPEWEVNNGTISENVGSSTVDWENEPPTITGSGPKTVAVGSALTLTATANDDGLPKPKKPRPQAAAPKAEAFNPIPSLIPEGMRRGPGLGIKWIVYRGPGKVIIDAPADPPSFGAPVTSTANVRFGEPGEYVLRAIAGDGALETTYDFPVTVTAGH